MSVTITYDFSGADKNDQTYVRSMLERFHFQRLGGSVFRYHGVPDKTGEFYEDWLNHVGPALMFFRSYVLGKNMNLKFFTIDTSSTSQVDNSDPEDRYGEIPKTSDAIDLATPTNPQSSVETIRTFLDSSVYLVSKTKNQ